MNEQICPQCNTPNRENAKFCRGCGFQLSPPPQTAQYPPAAVYPAPPPSPQPLPQQPFPAAQPAGAQPRRKKTWLWLAIAGLVLACLLCIIVLVAGYLVYDNYDQGETNQEQTQREDISTDPTEAADRTTAPDTGPVVVPEPAATPAPITIPGLDIALPRLSDEDEMLIGEEAAAQFESEYPLSANQEAINRVRRLGVQIAVYSPRKSIPYSFNLVASPEVNAFALPGGYIYVTEGMLDYVESDDELAGVIGHEIAHVALRHSAQEIEAIVTIQVAAEVALSQYPDLETVYADDSTQLAAKMLATATISGWGRQAELDADEYGTLYMAQAGFDPHAVIDLFTRLQGDEEAPENDLDHLFATHPPAADRIARVQESILKHHLD